MHEQINEKEKNWLEISLSRKLRSPKPEGVALILKAKAAPEIEEYIETLNGRYRSLNSSGVWLPLAYPEPQYKELALEENGYSFCMNSFPTTQRPIPIGFLAIKGISDGIQIGLSTPMSWQRMQDLLEIMTAATKLFISEHIAPKEARMRIVTLPKANTPWDLASNNTTPDDPF